MKPCIKNKIKLWWHQITNFGHRRSCYKQSGVIKTIFCFDCSYGEDIQSKEAMQLFKELK